jgi:hypothetical protein
VTPSAELQACAEHMRALGWYESHLFGHYYTWRASKAVYAVAFDVDHWALGYTIGLGVYKVSHIGNTLAALKDALAGVEAAKGAGA